jgi:hypothetical protein
VTLKSFGVQHNRISKAICEDNLIYLIKRKIISSVNVPTEHPPPDYYAPTLNFAICPRRVWKDVLFPLPPAAGGRQAKYYSYIERRACHFPPMWDRFGAVKCLSRDISRYYLYASPPPFGRLSWIRIEKEPSASANPVKNQGFNFGARAKVEYFALFICLERILIG